MCAKFRCHLCAGFLHFIPPKKGLIYISNANDTRQQRKNTTFVTDGDNNESSTNTSFTTTRRNYLKKWQKARRKPAQSWSAWSPR